MNRRQFLKGAAALPALSIGGSSLLQASETGAPPGRVRPHDPSWPSQASWDRLRQEVGGRLIHVESPLTACRAEPEGEACRALFKELHNPYFIGDDPALTQTSGWLDAWTAESSVYAVAAANTADMVAAVNFARQHNLRVVVKGGGHSYQGTSNSADSLLIWTRRMNKVDIKAAFVAQGSEGKQTPQPAVSVEAGAIWMQVYDAVTTRGGRYVQGGGCTTVGVAGLIQSGGFGSFSKNYGLAAAALLEAEVVTADGSIRIANSYTNPDLFWALKGGGGGTFGVVTRLTLRTRELPDTFGGVSGVVQAGSDRAFRSLIRRVIAFYRDRLFNPHWGEQIRFHPDNTVQIGMVFQGLSRREAEEVWQPFHDWVASAPQDFAWKTPLYALAAPARLLWDAKLLRSFGQQLVIADDRPGAPEGNVFWVGDQDQVGQFLHGYRSAWLPASLLTQNRQSDLAEALFAGSRHKGISLHFNKGLAGAPEQERAAARNTAINPAAIDAFALAIIAGSGPPAFPDLQGHEPDLAFARLDAAAINRAMEELLKVAGHTGSYVSESDFFERDWQRSFWGKNHPRLARIKRKYDPDGLFFVHHGVGSEEWSADGFQRLKPSS